MDRRAFLTALAGGAALGFDTDAFARGAPIEATVTRSSAAGVKIDWKGAAGPATVFAAATPYAQARALRQVAAGPAGALDVTAPAAPRAYFLVKARGGEVWTAERLLPLQGGRNFRDLGGYRTAGGKQVRWGKIYRSGVMSGLTFADMDYLSALGDQRDLRPAQQGRAHGRTPPRS